MFSLVLVCPAIGLLIVSLFAGLMTAHYGCRSVMQTAALIMMLSLPSLAMISSPWLLGSTLLIFGAAIGTMNCAMNTQAVVVEQAAGRSLMSGFHGFFSVGALVGSSVVTAMMSTGMTALVSTLMIVMTALVVTILSARHWQVQRSLPQSQVFARPRGQVIWLGIVCFVLFLTENSMLDWSGVFLHDIRGVDLAHAGWGYVVFNLAMMIARFAGERIITRFGKAPTVLVGGLLGGIGLLIATLVQNFDVSLFGYLLLGIGSANIVPVMFSLAGEQSQMPVSLAMAAVTTMANLGGLIGPAAIGLVASACSLTTAFVLVTLAFIAAAVLGSQIDAPSSRCSTRPD